jgi:signal recognition particle receptor subunit beta
VVNSRSNGDFYESPDWIAEEMTVRERRRVEEQIIKRGQDGKDVVAEEARIANMAPLKFDEVPWLVLLNQRDCKDRCPLKEVLKAMELEKVGMKEFRVFEGSVLKWDVIDGGIEWLVGRLRDPGRN